MNIDTIENQAVLKEIRGERIRKAMQEKKDRGGIIGPLPLGYRRSSYELDATIEIDPNLASIVLEIFHLAEHDYPVRAIAGKLSSLGMKNRRGNPISPTAVYEILMNPYYLGSNPTNLISETFCVGHPAIISQGLWDAVQAKLLQRKRH